MTESLPLRSRVLTALVAVAVPSLIFGRVGIAVVVLAALALAVPDLARPQVWQAVARRARTSVGWATMATAVLWLPGVVFSIEPQLSFEAWARTWVFVVVALLFWEIIAKSDGLRDLSLRAFILAVAVVLAIAAFGFAVPPFLAFIHAHGWVELSPVRTLKSFASAAMLMVPVILWATFHLGGKWRFLATLEVPGLLWLQVATGNRASVAGLLAMLIVSASLIVLQRQNRWVLIGGIAAIAMTISAALGWMYTIPRSPAWTPALIGYLDAPAPVWLIDLPRQEIWAFTWDKVLESPWIGHGINAINYLPGANEPVQELGGRITYIPGHPHDWVLEVLAETGFVGFVPVFVSAGLLFLQLLLLFRRTHDPAYLAAACVHTGYWVSGLFNFSFWSAWWQVSYLLLLALTCPYGHGPIDRQMERGKTGHPAEPPR